MGYDYRGGTSSPVGSVAPIGGPATTSRDTDRRLPRLACPASKFILGVPYYGRAWSTATSRCTRRNISGTKYGASTTVVYTTAPRVRRRSWPALGPGRGRGLDGLPARELHGDLWLREPVAAALLRRRRRRSGSSTTWSTATTCAAPGSGPWAMTGRGPSSTGSSRPSSSPTRVPPTITRRRSAPSLISPNGDGRMDTHDRARERHRPRQLRLARPAVLRRRSVGPAVRAGACRQDRGLHLGRPGPTPARSSPTVRTGSPSWAADASGNRAVGRHGRASTDERRRVTLAGIAASSHPNGDGHSDRTTLAWTPTNRSPGSARIFDKNGRTVRRWTFAAATAGSGLERPRPRPGPRSPTGATRSASEGLDRAGNQTVARPDRPRRSDDPVGDLVGRLVRPAGGPAAASCRSSSRRAATVTVAHLPGRTAGPHGSGPTGPWRRASTAGPGTAAPRPAPSSSPGTYRGRRHQPRARLGETWSDAVTSASRSP